MYFRIVKMLILAADCKCRKNARGSQQVQIYGKLRERTLRCD